MGTKHRDSGKSDASLHRPGFWSDTDPATTHGTGDDGVEPGMFWIKYSSGSPDSIVDVMIRNEANDGWESVLVSTPDHTHDGEDILTPETDQATSAYTLQLADAGDMVTVTHGSAATVTVPPNGSVAFDVGTSILIRQGGAGAVTIAAGAGVTLEAEGSNLKTNGQHAVAGLLKVGTDTWSVFGNLTS